MSDLNIDASRVRDPESARAEARPRVAVWRDTFAPYTETFIWDEVRHHVRWDATVFAWKRLNADRFPWDDVVTLDDAPLATAQQLLYRATSLSPHFLRKLAAGEYQLVHAHFGTAGVRSLPYVEALRLPLITMFHGDDLSRLVGERSTQLANRPLSLLAKRLFRRSAKILCVSEDLRRGLLAGGCPAEKIEVFHIGIDLTRFSRRRQADPTVHIVMVGRLVEKKGFEYGLRALAKAHAPGVSVRVTVIGEGPLHGRLTNLVSELGWADRVRFVGALPHEGVIELMGDADMIVAPSVVTPSGERDGGITVVKEAAACELPCVGSLQGGLVEIVDDGETGFLVPEHDVETLADRLGQLLRDSDLRRRFGAAARAKMFREYDIVERVEALERMYDEVVAAAPRPRLAARG